MALIPLVPETKMVDAGKLIILGNLWVTKVTCLCSQLRPEILSRAFWSRPHDKDCLYILSSFKNSFSHILTLSLSLSLSLHFDFQKQLDLATL